MTFIQLILTLGLCFFILYACTHREMTRYPRLALITHSMLGVVLVWNPEFANIIAAKVGVGRGADLILYCWVVLSLLVGFNLHVRLYKLQRKVIRITRELAFHTVEQKRKPTDKST